MGNHDRVVHGPVKPVRGSNVRRRRPLDPRPAETLGAGGSITDVALQSLVGAVFLHGAAADLLVKQGTGPAGLTASEVIEAARVLWNEWCAGDARHLRG